MLLLESYLFLAWARILKSMPFRWVAPSLGTPMAETPREGDAAEEAAVRDVSRMLHMASRHCWWEYACMVRAIAAMKMLQRRGIASTLYLGTAKNAAGDMIAHAWLRSGSAIVTGGEEMNGFSVAGIFGRWAKGREKRGNGRNG